MLRRSRVRVWVRRTSDAAGATHRPVRETRFGTPPGIGAVQTLSGRHITIGEDRIVEMSEEDANCLIPRATSRRPISTCRGSIPRARKNCSTAT
jgi:hypothetical protein